MNASKGAKIMKKKFITGLRNAVETGNISKARLLLDLHGVDPNDKPWPVSQPLLDLAVERNHKDIIKLLVQYGAKTDTKIIKYIFKYNYHVKELLTHVIKYNDNVHLLQEIFYHLTDHGDRVGPSALDIFKLLLDRGLPVDDFIQGVTKIYYFPDGHDDDDDDEPEDVFTPLQWSIENKRIDFVSLLLERGADINKKTVRGIPTLYSAVSKFDESIVELLLKKGARVNDITNHGRTPLHYACQFPRKPEIISILLEHGADVNVLDNRGKTPLTSVLRHDIQEILVKELAKSRFDNTICTQNMEFLQQQDVLRRTYERFSNELQRMKDLRFYNSFSLYDVLRMRMQRKRLTYLTKNEEFVAGFHSCRNRGMLENYGHELDVIFQRTLERRDILLAEEKKFRSIFKNYLPDLAICNIAYFANEYLFFE